MFRHNPHFSDTKKQRSSEILALPPQETCAAVDLAFRSPRIRYNRSPNAGAGSKRNKGYTRFLGMDQKIPPEILKRQELPFVGQAEVPFTSPYSGPCILFNDVNARLVHR